MIEIMLVNGDDWCGMYINGKLVEANHSFNVDWIEHFVKTTVRTYESRSAEKYMDEHICLPLLLSDVIFDT